MAELSSQPTPPPASPNPSNQPVPPEQQAPVQQAVPQPSGPQPQPGMTQQSPTASTQTTPQTVVPVDEKVWAAISYVPLMAFISFVIKPSSAYVRLHGRQGVLLSLIFLVTIFGYIFALVLPDILAWLFLLAGSLVHFGLLIVGVYSIYQALVGNWWKIPVLGDLAEKIPVEKFTKIASEAITGQPVNQDDTEGQNPGVNS